MYYIYSKEKLPKLLFDVNLTSDEVKLYGGWDVIFGYYPNIQKDNSTIIERDTPFNYPIFDNNIIREMTREEKVRAGIDVTLEDGEIIKDKKIITVPKPQGNPKYLSWNKEKGLWLLDNEREYQDYMNLIDDLKAKSLAYGFDYKVDGKEHRQKCRDKDITLLASNVTFMLAEKTVYGKEKTITWYFYDNFGLELNLEKSLVFTVVISILLCTNFPKYMICSHVYCLTLFKIFSDNILSFKIFSTSIFSIFFNLTFCSFINIFSILFK